MGEQKQAASKQAVSGEINTETTIENLRGALDESKARISALLDGVSDAIVVVGADGIIEVYNRTAETMFGFAPDEAVGKKASILMTPFDASRFDAYAGKLLNNNAGVLEKIPDEVVVGRKDGTSVLVSLKLTEINSGQKRLFMATLQDLTNRPPRSEDLYKVADFDTLTELHNYNYLKLELGRVLARIQREQGKPCALICALIYFNIDNFSKINDESGYEAGDELLIGLGKAFKQRLRSSDMAARLSADEFALLVYDTTDELAKYTGTQFHEFIHNQEISTGDKKIEFGCSIGVYVIDGSCKTVEDIFDNAIAACREAKKAGGDCLRVYEGSKT